MRADKQLMLDEIGQHVKAADAMVVVGYKNLSPDLSWELRAKLAQSGGMFEVVRKRVFIKAAQQLNMDLSAQNLEGHVGVLFAPQTGAMASIKTLFEFSKENDNFMSVLCGQLEGSLRSPEDLTILSQLPSLPEMQATFLGLLTSPASQLLSLFEMVMAGPLSILEQKTQQ